MKGKTFKSITILTVYLRSVTISFAESSALSEISLKPALIYTKYLGTENRSYCVINAIAQVKIC